MNNHKRRGENPLVAVGFTIFVPNEAKRERERERERERDCIKVFFFYKERDRERARDREKERERDCIKSGVRLLLQLSVSPTSVRK